MKPPEDPLLSLVRQWAAKAEIDHRTAERLLKDDDPIRESVAFPSQQAAEKYLKALPGQERTMFGLATRTREAISVRLNRELQGG
jgi:hypothetical protein